MNKNIHALLIVSFVLIFSFFYKTDTVGSVAVYKGVKQLAKLEKSIKACDYDAFDVQFKKGLDSEVFDFAFKKAKKVLRKKQQELENLPEGQARVAQQKMVKECQRIVNRLIIEKVSSKTVKDLREGVKSFDVKKVQKVAKGARKSMIEQAIQDAQIAKGALEKEQLRLMKIIADAFGLWMPSPGGPGRYETALSEKAALKKVRENLKKIEEIIKVLQEVKKNLDAPVVP